MLVGETPGDREDIEGHPFVGPAGRVLDEGLEQVGLARDQIYITNAVKHFRYRARGKRRIHQTPDRWQVTACLPWLEAELAARQARGARAASARSRARRCSVRRSGSAAIAASRYESDLAPLVTLTTHPAAILRVADAAERRAGDGSVRRGSQSRGGLARR